MGRSLRTAEGGLVDHALNRGNAWLTVFEDDGDYNAFLRVLVQAVARCDMRLLAYCVKPNHFHLLLWPHGDGDLSIFIALACPPSLGRCWAPLPGAIQVIPHRNR